MRNARAALTAAHHLNLAHGLVLLALREVVPTHARFSVALDVRVVRLPEGEDDDADAGDGADRIRTVANRVFLDPMLHGVYPPALLEHTAGVTDWSFVRPGDLDEIAQPIDELEVSYSSPLLVRERALPGGIVLPAPAAYPGADGVELLPAPPPRTATGGAVAPDALEEVLTGLHAEFPDLPLVVQIGAAVPETLAGAAVHDPERVDYLQRHLTAVHRAVRGGVPVRGVLVRSLLDGFEWTHGFEARYGVVRVDPQTRDRTVKDSGRWLAEFASTHTIPEGPAQRR